MLLKSVLSAIPNFYLSTSKVPASIEQKLSGLCGGFSGRGRRREGDWL